MKMSICSLILLGFWGCSEGGSEGNGRVMDTKAPVATIVFPPANSMTDGDTVKVYGTASDSGTITAVRVNGLNTQTSDGYANWEVIVPLTAGLNTLTVETEDSASNTDSQADQAVIERKRYFGKPAAIALDSLNNRFLVIDEGLDAVIAVDLTTKARTVLSDNSTPDTNNPFDWPRSIAIDSDNNRALLTDSSLDAVIAVDLTTGARTILSDNSTPDAANPLYNPRGIVLDSANNRALVADSPLNSIIAVDLTTGARTILSDDSTPDANNPFVWPEGIALDSTNNRALVTDGSLYGLGAVIAVDLTTGARTILSDDSTPDANNPFDEPRDITIDSANNRALVTNGGHFSQAAVIAVDLTTGARTILSDDSTPDANNPFVWPKGITLNSANNRALATDSYWDTVIAVDLTTGVRTVLYDNHIPDANNPFVYPEGIALDSANNRALVIDSLKAVIAVDLTTGERTVLSDNRTPDDYSSWGDVPRDIALDINNNRVLVTDYNIFNPTSVALIAVDLTTGVHTIFSNNSTPDANNPLRQPEAIALDNPNNRFLVTDPNLDAVIAVDLTTGARTIFSDSSTPDATHPLYSC